MESQGIIFSDGIHRVEMAPVIEKSVVATTGEDGKILFQGFNGTDDLFYSVRERGVKEEIVIHEKREAYQFDFTIDCTNLDIHLIDEERIIFMDQETGEEIFKMAGLVMFDARGEESRSITLSRDKNILTVLGNSMWINDETRVFPVTIDPQIEVVTKATVAMKCLDQNGNQVTAREGKFEVGQSSTSKNYLNITVDGQKVYLSTEYANAKYTLALACTPGESRRNTTGFKTTINGNEYEKGVKFDRDAKYIIDITKYVLNQSYFTIKIELGEIAATEEEYFYVYDYAHADENLRPTIRCENLDLGEAGETTTLDKQLTPDDKISIHLLDGTYLYTYQGPAIKDKALQIGVNFIHSSLKRTNPEIKDAHMGGLKTNLHQYLIKDKTDNRLLGSKKAVYIDGDNRSHELYERWFYETGAGLKNFIDKSNVYLDHDGELKTAVNGIVYEVKYDVVSDDGLSLISAVSLANYTKKSTKKLVKKEFKIANTQVPVNQNGNGTIKMPHYTQNPDTGAQLTQKPDWHIKPIESYNAASMSNETWKRWEYVDPKNVSNYSGSSYAEVTFRTDYYDLPLLKDDTGYYVEVYSSKEKVSYTGAGSHEILYKANTPTKVYLDVTKTYQYDEPQEVYLSDDLNAVLEKIKQVNQYLEELHSSRKSVCQSIQAVDDQINLTHKESTRFQVQIRLTDNTLEDKEGNGKKSANYANKTQAVSRAHSIFSMMDQRKSLLKQLGDLYSKIDEYEIMLENTLAEKEYLIKSGKDSISDLVIDKEGNALGFDYHGKLILMQDKFENKLEITYDEEKLISVLGEKEKLEFTYGLQDNLLEYLTDAKGRKIFFQYDPHKKIKSISKDQVNNSKKVVSLILNSNSNLCEISHLAGYKTTIEYQSNKVTNIKQESYVEYITDEGIRQFNYSMTELKVIFNESISYVDNQTTVTEARNNQKITYTFDQIGRVINEQNDDAIVVRNYEENKPVFEATVDKHSLTAVTKQFLTGTMFTKMITLGTSVTDASTINKKDSVNGMYTVLLNALIPSTTRGYQVTLSAVVVNSSNKEVPNTSFTVRYDSPKKQVLALPLYVPNDNTSTSLIITITSNVNLSDAGIKNLSFAKANWTLNAFDSEERLIKQTSGKEITEYLDFTGDKAARVVSTNLHNQKKTSIFEYDSDGNLVYSKDHFGNTTETYYNELGQVIEKRTYNEEAPSEVTTLKY